MDIEKIARIRRETLLEAAKVCDELRANEKKAMELILAKQATRVPKSLKRKVQAPPYKGEQEDLVHIR